MNENKRKKGSGQARAESNSHPTPVFFSSRLVSHKTKGNLMAFALRAAAAAPARALAGGAGRGAR